MKCPLKIVISVIYNNEKIDLEIPTDIKIKELKGNIIHSLNNYFKEKGVDNIVQENSSLYHGDVLLEDDKIMGNYGIWSGSIISMR